MANDSSSVATGAIAGASAGAAFGPWGAVIGAGVGIGISLWGMSESSEAAQRQTEAQKQMIVLEQRVEAQRRQAMELDARSKQMRLLRNAQKARSLALTTATAQGAGQGSGLQGGYGQISGDVNSSLLNVNQNLDIGRNIFGLNAQISQQKISMAEAGLQAQEGAAYSSLGSSILNSSGTIGKLSSGFGPSNPGNFPSSRAIY
jgi:hypothetical protein